MVPKLAFLSHKTATLVQALRWNVAALGDDDHFNSSLRGKPIQSGRYQSFADPFAPNLAAYAHQPDLACAAGRVEMTGDVALRLPAGWHGHQDLRRPTLAFESNPGGI